LSELLRRVETSTFHVNALASFTVLFSLSDLPSLMAAYWVVQNSGPIFCPMWIKVHRIKFACAGVSVVFDAIHDDFSLRSGDIRDQVAKLCEIARKF